MADRLDLARQSEAHRIDIAQQLEGERYVSLEAVLDFLHVGIVAHLVEQGQYGGVGRVDDLGGEGFRMGEVVALEVMKAQFLAEFEFGAGFHLFRDELRRTAL